MLHLSPSFCWRCELIQGTIERVLLGTLIFPQELSWCSDLCHWDYRWYADDEVPHLLVQLNAVPQNCFFIGQSFKSLFFLEPPNLVLLVDKEEWVCTCVVFCRKRMVLRLSWMHVIHLINLIFFVLVFSSL